MIFKSHFIAMFIFTVIISTMLAFIKYDEKKDIIRYGVKLFLYMAIGVIAVSWFMHYF
jgi:hypothetical protein